MLHQIQISLREGRRYFFKAEVDFAEASEMIELIGKLCKVVEVAEKENIPVRERTFWVDDALAIIRNWLLAARPTPGTSLERAIRYMDKYWKGLTVFRDRR